MAEKLKSYFQLPKIWNTKFLFFSLFFVFETATEIHFACLWSLFYLIAAAATITQPAHRKPFLHSRLCVIRAAASWLAMGFACACKLDVNVIFFSSFFFLPFSSVLENCCLKNRNRNAEQWLQSSLLALPIKSFSMTSSRTANIWAWLALVWASAGHIKNSSNSCPSRLWPTNVEEATLKPWPYH